MELDQEHVQLQILLISCTEPLGSTATVR